MAGLETVQVLLVVNRALTSPSSYEVVLRNNGITFERVDGLDAARKALRRKNFRQVVVVSTHDILEAIDAATWVARINKRKARKAYLVCSKAASTIWTLGRQVQEEHIIRTDLLRETHYQYLLTRLGLLQVR